ncbi:MAG: VOC family protein [Myxococcales bacterium]|nr:VOC family protein [Myxococcales bacterium]
MLGEGTGVLVWLGVTQLQRACDFYGKTLGLVLDYQNDEAGWAELRHPASGTRVGLRLTDEDELNPAGGATLVFDVQNLKVSMRELEKQEVLFLTGEMNLNGFRFATFVDPDGNNLQLRQADGGS